MKWTGLFLLAAACTSNDTSLLLTVDSQAVPSVSDLDVTVAMRTRSMTMRRDIELVIPDDWAGRPLLVEVHGRRGQVVLGQGSASAVPLVGERVPVIVTLGAVPCNDPCQPGESACLDGGVVECEQREIDGCMQWGSPTSCPEACSQGTCVEQCTDECSRGDESCAGEAAVRTCVLGDDGCTHWQNTEDCPLGTACDHAECKPTCHDACSLGDSRCDGHDIELCADHDLDGCLDWGESTPCGGSLSCHHGICY